jgi:hypothetical protein
MPRFYRIMLPDGDHPLTGDQKLMLGVRVGPPPRADVQLTIEGKVASGTGGMSVFRHWRDLPYFLIPTRLSHHFTDSAKRRALRGNHKARCWRMGEGSFEEGSINDSLVLRRDSPTHGMIEPSVEMYIDDFQAALAGTRDQWLIDED